MTELTVERAKELLNYDPLTGIFTWRIGRRGASKDAPAGCKRKDGYVTMEVDGERHYCHRLAWVISYGAWPIEQIDHINGDPSDNRLSNLREASNTLNSQNQRRPRPSNKVGYLGVSWHKCCESFRATIAVQGKQHHLGLFATAADAHQAYIKAKRRLHEGGTL